ncbi:BTB/POZ domain-containing protein At3g44820-like [Pistacia vera]|uniref:BTB/POZ domain-containing protein At3g44820-like n=1 Tax=Pistacia vera TaxID=55513 RepID=UPI001262B94B|nr:BTB/POZ domain-containing protein At3g44820-like [Pistacia vera]XP_031283480.1 BTB/POZ domain-containing protein At3g44820-like [Pistacia vera]XP_031283481.1 BTB/POZ domain-containing protein At3g44820-like [Pistacia vera]XP_031283482.1 BTB/POZ domain-containing protein At3g44820-like [Pistacia vera]XP_031283483.1 BTB/POZ domain-containing protein At3g44820-like [Pistacia vera]
MAPAGKVSEFYREGNDWYCCTGLPSDIIVTVEDINFHLHKFPLISKCGKIARLCEESQSTHKKTFVTKLDEFPGGPSSFLIAAKFCYGIRVEMSPRNIVMVYCAAHYLEMTNEYGEGNLVSKSESFFHKNVLRNWKDCILALQSSEPVLPWAEKLQILSKCLNALSMMVCTDPSLFGWPMMMYGSLQSPGGSILWNGINTGARIRSTESDWWFEDISYLSVGLFERLIKTMEARGIRPENLAGAIMYYARKYLPGLGRWQGGQTGSTRTFTSFSLIPTSVNQEIQKVLLESIEKLLPEKKVKSFCRFLLGLLRVGLILGVNETCTNSLERRIGMQLELATLDSLLIPSYSDSDTLYNTDCVERIVHHFMSSESTIAAFSPASLDQETSPSSAPLRKVAKLIDNYIAEVASDVNLKPRKIRSLAVALPESSRPLHDGLYRALDIYFKAHPWLSEKDKEELCNIIDYQKLSIDACAHASQNERLPLRIVLQVLFFEQIQLRTALAGCLHVLDTESAPAGPVTVPTDMAGQIVQRDGWVTVVRENQVLKVDMERMRSRVVELEQEFCKIRTEMKRVTKSHSSLSSPRLVAKKFGCRLLPRPSDAQPDTIESTEHTPRASVEQPQSSRHSRHRKSFSLF